MNECRTCRSKENLYLYDKKKNTYICRNCNTEKKKKYRSTKNGRIAYKKAQYRQDNILNIEKNKARRMISIRVKAGTIIKPKECSVCKLNDDIHAHHEDYSRPLWIAWLCRRCHVDVHAKCNTFDILYYMYDYASINGMNIMDKTKVGVTSFRMSQDDLDIINQLKESQANGIRELTNTDILRYGLSLIKKELESNKTPSSTAKKNPIIPQKIKVSNYPKTCPIHKGNWMSCGCKPEDSYELITN